MRNAIGWTLIVLGALLGLYVGVWVLFIGGIMGIASAIDLGTVTGVLIATNILKIVFSGLGGCLCFFYTCFNRWTNNGIGE